MENPTGGRCRQCGGPLPEQRRGQGRPRLFCSDCRPSRSEVPRLPKVIVCCLECGCPFEPSRPRHWFCCKRCTYRARDRSPAKRAYERSPVRRAQTARRRAERAMRGPRLCIRCGAPAASSRHRYCEVCSEWAKARRRPARGEGVRLSTVARGYGSVHQKLRKQWAQKVKDGIVACVRCGNIIFPGEPWDLGHDDQDRSQYAGPEHRRCNRATAGRLRLRRNSQFRANWW